MAMASAPCKLVEGLCERYWEIRDLLDRKDDLAREIYSNRQPSCDDSSTENTMEVSTAISPVEITVEPCDEDETFGTKMERIEKDETKSFHKAQEEIASLFDNIIDSAQDTVNDSNYIEVSGKRFSYQTMWEILVTALITSRRANCHTVYIGRAGDNGVDAVFHRGKDLEEKVVVQIKRGIRMGKGNNTIIRELIGAMVYFDARRGWICCSDARKWMSIQNETALRVFHDKGYSVEMFYREDLEENVPDTKDTVLRFLGKFLFLLAAY